MDINGEKALSLLEILSIQGHLEKSQLKRRRNLERLLRKEGLFHVHRMDAPGSFNGFQALNDISRCTTSLERFSLLDLAQTEYAFLLREGVASMQTLLLSTSTLATISSTAPEGWALKESKKAYRFDEKQKSYLEAKFTLPQETGRKLHSDNVAKEMRRALDSDGKRLFKPMEFLTEQRITSIFGRLAAKVRQQLFATDDDICVAEKEVNFRKAREEILADINLEHPIVFDQYNICALVRDNSSTKFKLGLLQILCEKFNLKASITDRRKKSSYVGALIGFVNGCLCGGHSGSD